MENKKWLVNKHHFYMLLLLFPIAFIAKLYQYTVTINNENNFGIMNYIKNIVDTGRKLGIKSFDFPASIYSKLKFLGFNSHLQWSIFFTVIFTIILFVILLKKYKKFSKTQYIYIFASAFLLIWTVFNMNKDLIQFVFLLMIYFILKSKNSNIKKIIFSIAVIVVEVIFFREYYMILAGLFVICYYSLSLSFKENKPKYSTVRQVAVILVFFFIAVYCTKFISKNAYDDLINRRESLISKDYITTIIQNVIKGTTYQTFIFNYVINFVRVCFPIELIKFGAKYLVFFVFQIANTFIVFLSIKRLNKKNLIWVAFVLGYTIMLVASESDFGTLARHQSVLLLFYVELMNNQTVERKEIQDEK